MKPQTAEWIEKAEGDWKVAQREWAGTEPVYDAICFHAQQTVEKYMKALLEEHELDVPKMHDLLVLLGLLVNILPELEEERISLAELSTCAVAFRYPGESAVREDAEASLQTAGKLRNLVRKKFNL
jgi:HEPN domain-containing protein